MALGEKVSILALVSLGLLAMGVAATAPSPGEAFGIAVLGGGLWAVAAVIFWGNKFAEQKTPKQRKEVSKTPETERYD